MTISEYFKCKLVFFKTLTYKMDYKFKYYYKFVFNYI